MKDKLYTKAEAIVKIQSGEWKEAIHTETKNRLIVSKEAHINLYCNNFASDRRITFYLDEKPMWKERKVEALFGKSSEEAIVGIFNKGETWVSIDASCGILEHRLLYGILVCKRPSEKHWMAANWIKEDMEAKWRKADNQEVEA